MNGPFRDFPREAVDLPERGDASADPQTRRLVREFEHRLDKLSLICCAMWTVIQAHTSVSDEELTRLVTELDLSDGKLDGKAVEKQVAPCAACGRPVATRHIRCIYCGELRKEAHPFEGVL